MTDIPDILNEQVADKIVIKHLMEELKKRGHMGKLLVDPENGKFYLAHECEELTNEDLDKNLQESKDNITAIEKARSFAQQLVSPAAPAPAEPTPVATEPVAEPQAEQLQPAANVVPLQ